MRKLALLIVYIICSDYFWSSHACAQITPPGITSGGQASGWIATGISQQYAKKWTTTVYIGQSWQSNPNDYSLLRKPAIFILNQETGYSFSYRWQLALCNSYRIQQEFDNAPPYASAQPGARREIRYYARLFYRHSLGKASFAHSVRPEYRTFYTPDWQPWKSPSQWRFRVKSQVALPLNKEQTLTWIVANDILAATSRQPTEGVGSYQWSQFRFTEDRLSTFLRIHIKHPELYLDPGAMYQVWVDGDQHLRQTIYFSMDLILVNPFTKRSPQPQSPEWGTD